MQIALQGAVLHNSPKTQWVVIAHLLNILLVVENCNYATQQLQGMFSSKILEAAREGKIP